MKNQEDWQKAECCGEKMGVDGSFGEQYVCRKCSSRIDRVNILEWRVLTERAKVQIWEQDLELLKRFEAGIEAEWEGAV